MSHHRSESLSHRYSSRCRVMRRQSRCLRAFSQSKGGRNLQKQSPQAGRNRELNRVVGKNLELSQAVGKIRRDKNQPPKTLGRNRTPIDEPCISTLKGTRFMKSPLERSRKSKCDR